MLIIIQKALGVTRILVDLAPSDLWLYSPEQSKGTTKVQSLSFRCLGLVSLTSS